MWSILHTLLGRSAKPSVATRTTMAMTGKKQALTNTQASSMAISASVAGTREKTMAQPDDALPEVDLVLVYQARDPKALQAKAPIDAANVKTRMDEFARLVQQIEHVGLDVTARPARHDPALLLVFVRAPDATLIQRAKEDGLFDYLHGVQSHFEPSSTSSLARSSSLPGQGAADKLHSQAQSFSSADRVRLTHALLTRPKPQGADVRVGSQEYPHLLDMTPVHDREYNAAWIKRWSKTASVFRISNEELDSIRSHFGEHIAYYFGFLNFYFQSLASIAIAGTAFWAAGAPFHPIYSLLLVIWALVFVEVWRMKERKLAVRWGTVGIGNVDMRRNEFTPRTTRQDPATGEATEVFEWWRRELRVAASLPVMATFAALLGATMTTMFATEVFVAKLYDGFGKQFVPLIPTALFVVCVPQIMAAWQATAARLTSWENHYSVRQHDSSMTIKMFALQGVVAYGALTLSAFVYIPFGQVIMDSIVQRGFFADSIKEAESRGDLQRNAAGGVDFDINPSRMHKQLFAVLTTSQAINAFTEIGLPFVMRKIKDYMEERKESKEQRAKQHPAQSSEARFMEKVEEDLERPPYDTFADYAEMGSQFGYIVLWSCIWPLAPVMGFINNFFELRSDAFKITVHERRPVPQRVESIGPWLDVIEFIAWLAALLNAALIYLFQPSPDAHLPGHSPYETVLRSHIHPGGGFEKDNNGTTTPGKVIDSIVYPSDPSKMSRSPLSFSNLLPSNLPSSGPFGALLAALLLALAAEHLYGIVRSAVRHILERALWRGSEEETELRRREWLARREALERSGYSSPLTGHAAPPQPPGVARTTSSSGTGRGFWRSAIDEGRDLIQSSSKSE